MSLAFEEPVGVPPIYTDVKRLSQILRNFIANALKFTIESDVRVSAHLEAGDYVTFAVKDTGIGHRRRHRGPALEEHVEMLGGGTALGSRPLPV